jgi:hypothetical protein
MSGRPLSRGSPLRSGGSSEGKFIIALVIIAAVLAAVAFALFAANQVQDKDLRNKQAELDAIGANLSQVTANLTSLRHDYTDLNVELTTVKANYNNVTQQYLSLQNKSSTVDTRLNNFLENNLTIAYTYKIEQKVLPDSSIDQVLTVSAYNMGKFEIPSVKIKCTVKVGNQTSEYNETYPQVMSLDKRQKSWEFGNGTEIVDVWAGVV